jgi:hypothetical protein
VGSVSRKEPSQRKHSALDSLEGYIVWGCWELKRKFRLKDGSLEEAAELIRELEHILAEEQVGQQEGPFRTCD